MDELYRQNAQIVYHFLYSRCRDRVLSEDLMQETFLQAIKSIDHYDGSCKISTWLCQIAKHLLYQYWARNNRIQLEELDEMMEAANDTERQALGRIELADIWDKLQNLPLEMRRVVQLRALSDLSYKEIGNTLGKSENWARVTFYRAKLVLMRET